MLRTSLSTTTSAVAVAGFAGYLATRAWPHLAVGVIGLTLVVPEAMHDLFGQSLGAAGVLLVAGVTLLGAALLGLRLRHEVAASDVDHLLDILLRLDLLVFPDLQVNIRFHFTTNANGEGATYFNIDNNTEEWDTIAITLEPQAGNELPQGEVVLSAGI